MLSYQHAFHAGGPADVHKHIALAELVSLLIRKKRPITYMETHAGRGMYDLGSTETARTGEASEGINAIELSECAFSDTLNQVRQKHGKTAYPGSPAVAQELLRTDDQIHLMELHPTEHKFLTNNINGKNVHIHNRDGYEGVMSISPPTPRKGLVLIDPSYEVKTEYIDVAKFVHRLIAKWPEATILIWYPILSAKRHEELLSELKLPYQKDEVNFNLKSGKGMTGSGLILVNAPYGSEAVFSKNRFLSNSIFT